MTLEQLISIGIVCVCVRVYTYIRVYTYTCIRIRVYVYMYTYTCVYVTLEQLISIGIVCVCVRVYTNGYMRVRRGLGVCVCRGHRRRRARALFGCWFVRLFIHSFIWLLVCLSIRSLIHSIICLYCSLNPKPSNITQINKYKQTRRGHGPQRAGAHSVLLC